MKHLSLFTNFDITKFLKDKELTVVETSEYVDYDTKEHLGTKVKVAITKDNTDYGPDATATNKYEFLIFKCRKDVEFAPDTVVSPKGVTARVYGEYHNQLSLFCEDIIAVGNVKETNHV